MVKVGIITFHASYNFGSVMQAWALQDTVEKFGYSCDVINFRMLAQKDKYSLFPLHSGKKIIIRNLIQIGYIRKKNLANCKYEAFINQKLHLTDEMNLNCDLQKREWNYDIYLAGSDQIWAHSIPEFVSSKEDTRRAYYFEFSEGYKISYASSTGEATFENLVPYKDLIQKFSHIAVREQRGKELLQRLTGRNIEVVLDPTYLVLHKQWSKIASQIKCPVDQKYILIYSLQGYKKKKVWKEVIRRLYNQFGLEVVSVSPFAPI